MSTLQQQARWSCQPNGSCSSCCSKTVVEVLVMTTIQVDIASEYGMMFLYDSKVRPAFPTEAGTSPVSWTSTCLAFSVLIYVDGNAKIRLCDSPGDQSFTERFRGIIECPSKAIFALRSQRIRLCIRSAYGDACSCLASGLRGSQSRYRGVRRSEHAAVLSLRYVGNGPLGRTDPSGRTPLGQ